MVFIFLILSIILLCFAGQEERTHPDEHAIEFHSILEQPDNITCGPTSATMILCHYGKQITPNEVKSHSKTVWYTYNGQDIGMTGPDYLAIAMNNFGIPSSVRFGDIDVLKHYISQDRPCIVLIRSSEHLWHYIVVYGFTKDEFMIANPSGGRSYLMNQETFQGCWSWNSDSDGNPCQNGYLCTLLQMMEVYPNTFICPDKAFERIYHEHNK